MPFTVPMAQEALAALEEVESRFFAAEGHAEDAVVGAVSGAVASVDGVHDQLAGEAQKAFGQVIAAVRAIVAGEPQA